MNWLIIKFARVGITAIALTATAGAAFADGMDKGPAPAPAAPKSDWVLTGNFAGTSEYVFRGFSQSAQTPTVQAGVDLAYKWFYIGAWGSGIDFGRDNVNAAGPGKDVAHVEVDLYAGIKPVIGRFNFDFGVIAYVYPNALDRGRAGNPPLPGLFRELNYYELKGGVSTEVWKDATAGVTAFWTPTGTNDTGSVTTIEGAFSQVLPKARDITPTFGATLGYQTGNDTRYRLLVANNAADNYLYWNAGMTLGFGDRFSVDLRYWDTNIKSNNLTGGGVGNFCTGSTFQCDERFVATLKVTY